MVSAHFYFTPSLDPGIKIAHVSGILILCFGVVAPILRYLPSSAKIIFVRGDEFLIFLTFFISPLNYPK